MKYDDVKKNKFYMSFYRDKLGHPSLVVDKNDNGNKILIVKFTTEKTYKDAEKKPLNYCIDPKADKNKKSYIVKYPFIVKGKNLYYKKQYENFRIHKSDNFRVKNVSKRKPK